MAKNAVFDLCLTSTRMAIFDNQYGGLAASFDQIKTTIYRVAAFPLLRNLYTFAKENNRELIPEIRFPGLGTTDLRAFLSNWDYDFDEDDYFDEDERAMHNFQRWWGQWGKVETFWVEMGALLNTPTRPVRTALSTGQGLVPFIGTLDIVSVAGEQVQLSLVNSGGPTSAVLVWDVKVEIERLWGCTVLEQLLYYIPASHSHDSQDEQGGGGDDDGCLLANDSTLQENGVEDGATLQLALDNRLATLLERWTQPRTAEDEHELWLPKEGRIKGLHREAKAETKTRRSTAAVTLTRDKRSVAGSSTMIATRVRTTHRTTPPARVLTRTTGRQTINGTTSGSGRAVCASSGICHGLEKMEVPP
jgi:hypothetical protein